MASDAPTPESADKPKESTSLVPDWLTADNVASVAGTAATTVGLAALPVIGTAAAVGYAAYNALSGDSGKESEMKSAESGKSLIEQAGQKILEEISKQPPSSTTSSPNFGTSLTDQLRDPKQPATSEAQRNPIASGILDLSANPLQGKQTDVQKEPDKGGILKTITEAVKTLEIPKLPELSAPEKPQPASSSNPEPSSTVKPAEPSSENKSGFVQAAIEKLGLNLGSTSTPSEQQSKAPESNAKPDSPSGKAETTPPKPEITPGAPAEQPAKPADQPAKSAEQSAKPADQPAKPTEQPAKPADQPAKPAEQSAKPADQPAKPAEQPAKPADQPAKPAEQPAKPADQPARPAEQSAKPADQPQQPAQPVVDTTKNTTATSSQLPGALSTTVKDNPDNGPAVRLPKVEAADNGSPGSPSQAKTPGSAAVDDQGAIRKSPAESGSGPSNILQDKPAASPPTGKPGDPAEAPKTKEIGGQTFNVVEVRTGGNSVSVAPRGADNNAGAIEQPKTTNVPVIASQPGSAQSPGNVGDKGNTKPGSPGNTGSELSKTSVPSGVMPVPVQPAQPAGDERGATRDAGTKGVAANPPGSSTSVGTAPGDSAVKNAAAPDSAKVPAAPDVSTIAAPNGRQINVQGRELDRNVTATAENGAVRKPDDKPAVTGQGAPSVDNSGKPTAGPRDSSVAANNPANPTNPANPASPVNPANPANPVQIGKTPGDVVVSDQASGATKIGTGAGVAATTTTGDTGRNCGGPRPDCNARSSVPDGATPTRMPDSANSKPADPAVRPTDAANRPQVGDGTSKPTLPDGTVKPINNTLPDATNNTATTGAMSGTARPQSTIDTTSGNDRNATRPLGVDKIADATPNTLRTTGEIGKPGAEVPRISPIASDRAAPGDMQAAGPRLNESALKGQEITRINQAIDRILENQPELRHAAKDAALREIIRQLTQEGLLPANASTSSLKALEVVKILLDQKLSQPQSQSSAQQSVAGQDPTQATRPGALLDGQLSGRQTSIIPNGDAAGNPSQRQQVSNQNQSAPTGFAGRGGDTPLASNVPQQTQAGQQLDSGKGPPLGTRDGIRLTGETPVGNVKAETGFAPQRALDPQTSKADLSNGGFNSQSTVAHTRFETDKVRGDAGRDQQATDRSHNIKANPEDSFAAGRRHAGQQPEQLGHKPYGVPEREPSSHHSGTDKTGIDRREVADKEGDAKPHTRKADHDGNRGNDAWIAAAAASMGGIARSDDRKNQTDKKQPQTDIRKTDRRAKYIVKFGDTLESIATKQLGDKRFTELLITINRSLIRLKFVGLTRVPDLRQGQMIWLPTADEAAIHRRTFFSNSGLTGGATTIPQTLSAPGLLPSSKGLVPKDLIFMPPALDIVDESKASQPNATAQPAPMAQILYRIRFAGNKQAIPMSALHAADLGYIARRNYIVRLGDTIRSVALRDPLMGDAGLWTLIARVNNLTSTVDPSGAPIVKLRRGQVIQLPNPHEIDQHKLLGRFASLTGTSHVISKISESATEPTPQAREAQAQLPSHRVVQPPVPLVHVERVQKPTQEQQSIEVEARMLIQRLAENCRILSADAPSDAFSYSIKLQSEVDGRWTTIASYECGLNWAARYLYHRDGRREHLDLDLPVSVVREMAKEDFLRNWATYTQQYNQDDPTNRQRLA